MTALRLPVQAPAPVPTTTATRLMQGIRLTLWELSIVAEIPLTYCLWKQPKENSLPWFTVWMTGALLSNVAELATRHVGWLYDPLWRICASVLTALLCLAVSDSAKALESPVKAPLIRSVICGIILHPVLLVSTRWPGSDLEAVFSGVALMDMILGLFLIQLWAAGRGRFRNHALILSLYMLATAACYYPASVFPQTIGRAVMGVELCAVLAWLWLIHSERDIIPLVF